MTGTKIDASDREILSSTTNMRLRFLALDGYDEIIQNIVLVTEEFIYQSLSQTDK